MVAVIADDFTGAAELAGIGLRYGLKVQLAMPGVAYNGADLFIIATDSRSLKRKEAEEITANVVKYILQLQPGWIYKKIDSVLRGHVLAELGIEMQAIGTKRAFVLPANPSLGRTIKNGHYYIHNEAISRTGFAADPEFAINHSSVLQMIGSRPGEVKVVKHSEVLPGTGIVIGEAETERDVVAWANKVDKTRVLAGAGDFFTALLERSHKAIPHRPADTELPYLYVSGTAFEKSRQFVKQIEKRLGCVAYLPLPGTDINKEWLDRVRALINNQQRCVIAIGDNVSELSAAGLRLLTAKAVKEVLERADIKEVFIEGGSTAASILEELNISSLEPVDEWQRGVVRMKAKNWLITVKPGSYEIPRTVEKIYA